MYGGKNLNQNVSLRQNMQIPHQNSGNAVNVDQYLEKLSECYELQNIHEVKDFIEKNLDLIPYVNKITPLINNCFSEYKKCLTFAHDPEFDDLSSLIIHVKSLESRLDEDFEKLINLEREFIALDGFSTQTKSLIILDLRL